MSRLRAGAFAFARNSLSRLIAVVDYKGVNEIAVFSPSSPARPGGTEGQRDDLHCSI